MKRMIAAVFCAAILTAALPACGKNDGRIFPDTTYDGKVPEEKEDQQTRRIRLRKELIDPAAYAQTADVNPQAGTSVALIGRDSSSPYWDYLLQGAEDAVEELNARLGYKGKDKITLLYDAPAKKGDVKEQVAILDEVMNSNTPDVICMDLIDEKACAVQFDLASDNSIPVIAMSSGKDDESMVCQCSAEHEKVGTELADRVARVLGDTGSVAVMGTRFRAQAERQILQGFMSELETNHPDIQIQWIEAEEEADSEETLEEVIEEVLEEETDADTEIISKCGVCLALDEEAAKYLAEQVDEIQDELQQDAAVPIYGIEAYSFLWERMQEGSDDGFILDNAYGEGYASVVAALRTLEGQSNTSHVDTGFLWVTKDTMNTETVAALLYF